MPPPPAPWERQPKEPSRGFAHYAYYRDLGAARSLDKVREMVGKKPTYVRQIEKWSSKWRWVERAQAWDDEQDRLAREGTLTFQREMRERHLANSKLAQDALLVFPRELLERLARHDPETMQALAKMPIEDLGRLAIAAARAQKAVVSVDLAVTGQVNPLGPEEDAEAGEVAEVLQRLEEAARRRRTAPPASRGKASAGKSRVSKDVPKEVG